MSEYSSLEETIQCLMYGKEFEKIQDVLKSSENKNVVQNQAMNLVSVLCSIIKENSDFLKDPDQYQNCCNILIYLIDQGNPKEVLVGLLESADSFKEDEYFIFILHLLKKLFSNMPEKRGKTLEWVLSVLYAHLLSIPRPDCKDLKGRELLFMDLDPVVQRTAVVLEAYLNFLKFFVEEVSSENITSMMTHSNLSCQQLILRKYLLLLLEYPLVYHDLHLRPNQALSSVQCSCSRIITYLQEICKNFFDLYKLVDDYSMSCENNCKPDIEEKDVSPLAIANLSYLIFFENMAPSVRPHVYSHTYLFELHLSFMTHMLCKSENLVIYKGLHLCNTLLDYLPDEELPSQSSKIEQCILLSKNFFNIAVYSSVKDHRFLAVSLFKKYIKKFKRKERYVHLMHMLTSFQHSGVQGLIVNIYKDFLYAEITNELPEKHFGGENLLAFIRLAVHLKDGAKTDILENYDQILSCLNFVRFLALCDERQKSVTGFWEVADILMKEYLVPLHQGIELTRAHYKLAATSDSGDNHLEAGAATAVTVDGESLPDLPPDYKAVIFEKAMLSLDMVESILTRVKELLEKN